MSTGSATVVSRSEWLRMPGLLLPAALLLFLVSASAVGPVSAQTDAVAAANKVAADADRASTGADETRLKALGLASDLKRRSGGVELNREALGSVAELTRIVRRVSDTDLASEIKAALAALDAAKTRLGTAKTNLAAVSPQTDETNKATQRVNAALAALDEVKPRLESANAELAAALKGVYGYVAGLAVRAEGRLGPLKRADIPAADLLALLPGGLPALAETMRYSGELKAEWKNLSAALGEAFEQHAANVERVDITINTLDASLAAVVNAMEPRMKSLADYASQKGGNIASLIEQVKAQPAASAEEARERIREGALITSGLDRVSA
ncbi:MAG TPA: hypothetical protein VGV38_19930, partial [Pyrinomonadaceae bacterium]|nr:hypothetical protein [Pyrinomonadaceae bacterium]